MTDTVANTARHPSAAICWAQKDGIYVEYPTKSGTPYIVRYPKTQEGLVKALNVLIEHPAPEPKVESRLRPHPAVSKVTSNISEETRITAAEIVRRMLK